MITAERHQVAILFVPGVAVFDVIELDVGSCAANFAGLRILIVVLFLAQFPCRAAHVITIKKRIHSPPPRKSARAPPAPAPPWGGGSPDVLFYFSRSSVSSMRIFSTNSGTCETS